uniref:Uncharacterized protein n=1 Tax=Globodera rostochiensis TaxID=31243 RepID=A0A914HVU7_GLORO
MNNGATEDLMMDGWLFAGGDKWSRKVVRARARARSLAPNQSKASLSGAKEGRAACIIIAIIVKFKCAGVWRCVAIIARHQTKVVIITPDQQQEGPLGYCASIDRVSAAGCLAPQASIIGVRGAGGPDSGQMDKTPTRKLRQKADSNKMGQKADNSIGLFIVPFQAKKAVL